jgi:hypothetical protein
MKKLTIIALCLISLQACKHDSSSNNTTDNTTNDPTVTSNCDADTTYFVNTVYPILLSNCTTSLCHDANSPAEGVNLTNYSSIIKTAGVVPGNHSQSKLYKMLVQTDEDIMPPTGALAQTDIDAIAQWIDQGAKNNKCIEDACNTSNVSFATDVMPTIQSNCTSCHGATSPSGGTSLTNYTTVKAAGSSGALLGTIKHQNGYPTWVTNGMPNN